MKSVIGYRHALGLVVALGWFMIGPASAAPVFGLTASSVDVNHGSVFTVNVTASGLTDLYAYQFSLNFNPGLFQATIPSATEGPFLATAGATFFDGGSIDNIGGQISFVFDTLIGPGPGANGSGILDSFSFRVVGNPPASGAFSLSDVLALDSSLNVIAVQTPALAVSVAEPAPVALLFIGVSVMMFGAVRRGTGEPPISPA